MKRKTKLKLNRIISKILVYHGIFFSIVWTVLLILDFSKENMLNYIIPLAISILFTITVYYHLESIRNFEKELSNKLQNLNGKRAFFLLKNRNTDRMIVDYLKDILVNKGFENIVVLNCDLIFLNRHYLNKLDCYEGHINIIEARYPGDKR